MPTTKSYNQKPIIVAHEAKTEDGDRRGRTTKYADIQTCRRTNKCCGEYLKSDKHKQRNIAGENPAKSRRKRVSPFIHCNSLQNSTDMHQKNKSLEKTRIA